MSWAEVNYMLKNKKIGQDLYIAGILRGRTTKELTGNLQGGSNYGPYKIGEINGSGWIIFVESKVTTPSFNAKASGTTTLVVDGITTVLATSSVGNNGSNMVSNNTYFEKDSLNSVDIHQPRIQGIINIPIRFEKGFVCSISKSHLQGNTNNTPICYGTVRYILDE